MSNTATNALNTLLTKAACCPFTKLVVTLVRMTLTGDAS